MKFAELGLSPSLMKAIDQCGYDTPTPIQAQAIPLILQGKDVLGSAQTGSGKTAGFALPLIEALSKSRSRARMPRALILEPTRELAAQVLDDFIQYGKFNPLKQTLVTGGVKPAQQQRELAGHVDTIIATPGRLLDMHERGRLLLVDVRHLVIDEADRMLDMGFMPDVERIVSLLPADRQTLFFSATFDKQVIKLSKKFLKSPEVINVSPPSTASATVEHRLIRTQRNKKIDALIRALSQIRNSKDGDFQQAIIFCNRKRDIQPLRGYLRKAKDKIASVMLHGDINQSQRTETLAAFKAGKSDILIASDVAARGLDIETISHVFNYDVPKTVEDYIHRIGRTGRAGRSGTALTMATEAEQEQLDAIIKQLAKSGKKFQEHFASEETPHNRDDRRDDSREDGIDDGGDDRRDDKPRARSKENSEERFERRPKRRTDKRSEGRPERRSRGRFERRSDERQDGRPERRSRGRYEGRSDERQDGRPEGRSRGRYEGRSEGKPEGRSRGRYEGRSDERRSEGRPEGRSRGRYEGRSEGRPEGRSRGRYEGRSEGRRSEGRPEGRSRGRYEGRSDGRSEGRFDKRRNGESSSHHKSKPQSPKNPPTPAPAEQESGFTENNLPDFLRND